MGSAIISGIGHKWNRLQVGSAISGIGRKWDRLQVGSAVSGIGRKWNRLQVGSAASGIGCKWDRLQVESAASGIGCKWDRLQVGSAVSGTSSTWQFAHERREVCAHGTNQCCIRLYIGVLGFLCEQVRPVCRAHVGRHLLCRDGMPCRIPFLPQWYDHCVLRAPWAPMPTDLG